MKVRCLLQLDTYWCTKYKTSEQCPNCPLNRIQQEFVGVAK